MSDPSTGVHPPPQSSGAQLVQASSESLPSQHPSKRFVLNVGGIRHEVMWKTLDRLPHTRLGKLRYCTTHEALMELCDDYNFAEMEFFFDRQSRSFSSILNFYQTGKLHLAEDVCVLSFKDDLDYWSIDERYLESCCQDKYHHRRDQVLEEIRRDAKCQVVEDFGTGCCPSWRRKVWDLLENPHTSTGALLWTIASVVLIVVLAVTLMASTLPVFAQHHITEDGLVAEVVTQHTPLSIIEILCTALLTVEFILRFWSSPSKLAFIKDAVNIIDLLANIFFYISLMVSPDTSYGRRFKSLAELLQILRLLRLVKISRYSTGIRSLGRALRRSYKELGVILMFLVIEVIVFSSMIYFVERHEVNGQFISIPDAFWWAVVTTTTVGYGDQIPVSVAGKLVGTGCCISGVLFIILPIPIIVNNVRECCREQVRRQRVVKHGLSKRCGADNPTVNIQDANSARGGGASGGVTDRSASIPLIQVSGRNHDRNPEQLQPIGTVEAVSSK